MSDNPLLHNDEPAADDALNRKLFATALARVAESCDAPMVVGLYGTWGLGKTSLMKLIDRELDKSRTRTVWFDPWQHQFDENPALALLHGMVDSFGMSANEEIKKLLTVISAAFGSVLLKATTTLGLDDIDKLGTRYEEEKFQVREHQLRLQQHFKDVVAKAQGGANQRVVFFIDDLDRCMPEQTLGMLEALKLYLNLPGCVYFLGVDREALERSIKHHYEKLELSQTSYLDKIVQLPFTIPPIAAEDMEDFVRPLLGESMAACAPILVKGLGDNPRQVKRFINTLALNHHLATGLNIEGYDPQVLAGLLLIQHRNADLYRLIARRPSLLHELTDSEPTSPALEEALEKDERLKTAIAALKFPKSELLASYIHLTGIARVEQQVMGELSGSRDPISLSRLQLTELLRSHGLWVLSGGREGEKVDLTGAELIGADLVEANLRGATLRMAKLVGADLGRADLRGTDLRDADLTEADLHGASLAKANLFSARLNGANLSGADLRGVDLADVSGLTRAQLDAAQVDDKTKLPPDLE